MSREPSNSQASKSASSDSSWLSSAFPWYLVILFFSTAHVAAGTQLGNFGVTHWTRENGLPDNSVTCLTQTRDGFLWLGTASGLARFDGLKFLPLELRSRGYPAVKEVTALYQDVSERLWIGTRGGGLWCLESGVIHQVSPGHGLDNCSVTSIAGQTDGALWVGTTGGLALMRGTNVFLYTTSDGLPGAVVSSVHVSSSGTIWVTTRQGMCQFREGRLTPFEFQTENQGSNPEMIGMYDDQRGNLWAFGDTYLVNLNDGKRFNYFRSGDTTSLRIWSLCEGRDGKLWIGTSGQGVFSFFEGQFRPLSLREASLDSDVQAIYEDREGSLWLGTFSGGLVRLQPRVVQVLDSSAGLPAEMASCLAAGGAEQLWAGYASSGLFARSGDRFDKARTSDGADFMNLITSMATTTNGELWIGTLGQGLVHLKDGTLVRLNTENGLADDEILAVSAQKDGSLWAGSGSGTVHHVHGGCIESFNLQSGSPVTCLLATDSGGIWCGSENGSLETLSEGRFISVDQAGVLSGTPVRALSEDATGRLWIGTQGHGLASVAGGHLTLWESFPDKEVNAMVSDESGDLWLSTRTGIYRLEGPAPNRPAVLQLVTEHDLSSPGLWKRGWPQAVSSRDHRLWFATPKGICAVDPHDLPAAKAAPRVQLSSVLVNGLPLSSAAFSAESIQKTSSKALRFPSSLRTLEFEFTVASLNWAERVQFQHRLDHFDGDWVDGAGERRVRYNRLPFGQYEFHVRAKDPNGAWGEDSAVLAFEVPAPLWRSYPVLALTALFVVGSVAVLVRVISHRRLRLKLAQLGQQQAMERERMRIARDVHDELGSKLTRISYLSELALHEEAPSRQSVRSIAQMIHDLLQTLDEIVWAVNPQNDTLDNLAAYLGQYATEYLQNTSVDCEVNITPNLPVYPLTAETRHNLFLAFKEAIGNALRHSQASRVQVTMSHAERRFEIVVTDNGQVFNAEATWSGGQSGPSKVGKTGNGLVNMKARLGNVGGEANIESCPGQGTRITFRLPLQESPGNTK